MDWKIIAALVVGVAIVVSGFFGSGAVGGIGASSPNPSPYNPVGDFISGASGAVNGFFSKLTLDKNLNRTLQVSGSVTMQDSVLKLDSPSPASSVAIEATSPDLIVVGGEKISPSSGANISVDNFVGGIDLYQNGTVYADGSAESISLDGAAISSNSQKTVSVRIEALADGISIYNITLGVLYFNASGAINVGQEKAALKMENELLQIENFRGDLGASGAAINVTGFSTRILLNGKDKVVVG